MNHLEHLLIPLFVGLSSALMAAGAFRKLNQFEGRKKILMRNVLISLFWGVISASGAVLAIVIWSFTRKTSDIAVAGVGAAIVAVCGVYFVRSYLPLRRLGS